MSTKMIPEEARQQTRSKSQNKISHSKTPESYTNKIIQLFGQIYQCQFGRGEIKQRQKYLFKKEYFMNEVGGESNEQMQVNHLELSNEQVKQLIFEIKQRNEISQDFDFFLDSKGKKYQQLQKYIQKLPQDKKNFKNHELWVIRNYLQIDESQFQDKSVGFFFQIKRNLFTQDRQMQIKKQYSAIEQNKTQKKKEAKCQIKYQQIKQVTYSASQKHISTQKQIKNENVKKQESLKGSNSQNSSQNQNSQPSKNSKQRERQLKEQLVSIIKKKANISQEFMQDLQNTRILANIKQLIKNSLGASMYSKNKALNPNSVHKRFSYYLVVNQDLFAGDFQKRFRYFKNYLKLWFNQLGGILHIIGFNPQGEKKAKKQEQLLNDLQSFQGRISSLQKQKQENRQKFQKLNQENREILKKLQTMENQNNELQNKLNQMLEKLEKLSKQIQNKKPQNQDSKPPSPN